MLRLFGGNEPPFSRVLERQDIVFFRCLMEYIVGGRTRLSRESRDCNKSYTRTRKDLGDPRK